MARKSKKQDLEFMEKVILDSMKFDTVCPHCGRAVHIEPKDLIWQFGMTIVDKDGNKETKLPSGFIYECQCKKHIPVFISVGIDENRIEKDK